MLFIPSQHHIEPVLALASPFLPAYLAASPSRPNLHLSERARCHADSGTQRCQGLAAAASPPPNMISARPPPAPAKKVKWNPRSLL